MLTDSESELSSSTSEQTAGPATVTWAHHAIISGKRKEAIISLALTVALGVIFTGLQGMEYYEAPFTISDSVYGSTFFVMTGAHGGHVLIGSSFLLVCRPVYEDSERKKA